MQKVALKSPDVTKDIAESRLRTRKQHVDLDLVGIYYERASHVATE